MTDNKSAERYYRKSSLTIKIFKYVAVLLLIVFLISCIVIFRRDITVQNIQLLAKYISLDGSSSNYTEEFSVSSNDDSVPIMLRDNLGIIQHNNISLYDLSGQKMFSYNYSYSAPAVTNDEHSIIVYDIKGKELSLFNSFSKIKTLTFEGGIACADIKDDTFAVISSEDSFRSVLSVYEFDSKSNDYVEIYKYKSSSVFLTSVSLSPNSRYVLTTSIEADNGNYTASAMIYDTLSSEQAPLYHSDILSELPVSAGFSDNGNSVYVITDSNVIFYNSHLEMTSTYKFNQSKISNFYTDNNNIILTEKNNLAGKSMLLTCLSQSGDIIFKENIPDEVVDICFGTSSIFALGKNGVYKISIDNQKNISVTTTKISEKYKHILSDTDNNCYVMNTSSVHRIEFSK